MTPGDASEGVAGQKQHHDGDGIGHAQRHIAEALPPLVASIVEPAVLDNIYRRLMQLPAPPERARLSKDEWLGALGVFLWVFASTFPVVVPFLFVSEPLRAVRLSNTVALVMLYLTGHALGRVTGHRTWLTGLAMVAVGARLVALTIALGG